MKNNCIHSENIYLYFNDELDSNKKEELMEHLKACKECEEEFIFLDTMESELKNFEEVELPEDFNEKLHKKLVASNKETKVFKIENYAKVINRFISVAAAVILLAVITRVVYLYSNTFNQSKGLSNIANNSLGNLSTAMKDEPSNSRSEKSNVNKIKEDDEIYVKKDVKEDVSASMSENYNNDTTKSSNFKNSKGLMEQEKIQSVEGSIDNELRSKQPSNNNNLYSAVSEPRTIKDDRISNTVETNTIESIQDAKGAEEKFMPSNKSILNGLDSRKNTSDIEGSSVNRTQSVNFNEVSFETVVKNDNEGFYKERRNYIITDNKAWEDLWDKAVSSENTIPKVDFEQNMVIAVFQGLKDTSGYKIQINKVIEKDNLIEVFIQESSPASDDVVIQAITSPYHVVKIKKADKEVKFIYNNE